MIHKLGKTFAFVVVLMFVVSALAVAAEMTCTKADDKGCTMAQDASGKEIAVIGASTKDGDEMNCTENGTCTVLPGQVG